jgi:hypothetical protein
MRVQDANLFGDGASIAGTIYYVYWGPFGLSWVSVGAWRWTRYWSDCRWAICAANRGVTAPHPVTGVTTTLASQRVLLAWLPGVSDQKRCVVIVLKGGFRTIDQRLDRLPQFDEKSRQYRIRQMAVGGMSLAQRKPRSFTWGVNQWLDQGQEGRCVEYSICHDLVARPKQVSMDMVQQILDGKRIYWPAQEEDQWEGGSYPGAKPQEEGTSVLAGVKVAARLGFYKEYRWAMSLEGAVLGLGHVGPLILGINWYEGCYDTDADGFVHVSGELAGGHAIMAHAVRLVSQHGYDQIRAFDQIDLEKSYIVLHNSWGPGWGVKGRAKLSLSDFDRLRQEDGEVCIISQRTIPKALPAG